MKNRVLSLLASIALLSLASCTDEVQELAGEQSQALKQIVMTTQDFQPEAGSRTVYQVADGAVKCTWAENDTVGVFPDKGAQAYFPMALGAGTKNATFDGEGWALKDGRTYGAYYPFVGAMYLDRNAVPVSYAGQTQTGNGSMAHLGDYDYMVATPTAPEFGSAQFMFKHLSALAQLKITVPQPTTFTSVKLVTDTKAFAVEGKVDIMAETPGITPVTSSTEMVLNLQDVATTKENEVVTFYFMLPPADLSGKTLKAVIVSDKGSQEIALEGKNFKAGTAYALSGEMESTEAGYKDGVIRIAEAGSMKQLLGNNCLNITSLKVVGPINGDDVLCLRQMLGGSEFDDAEKGKLVTLDLSKASIVEGGGIYLTYYGEHKTTNDVIGDYMFHKCSNLQEVILPESVTSIGNYTFVNCSSLISIDIPKGVTSIAVETFFGCSSLTSINIPNGVTSIGFGAFHGCSSLTSINIPDGVTSIGVAAFEDCSSLLSINIPDGVTSIASSAYRGCSSLTSIALPSGVTSIGSAAFQNCSSLTSIDFPKDVTSIGEFAFYGCFSLTSIALPAGVTSIGGYAFRNCSSLTSINLPAGVTSIGSYAFYGCSSLTSIALPSGVTSIGNYAFYECSYLSSINIPKGVVSIGDYAFYRCSSLTSIDIPACITSIGSYAFQYCTSLNSIYISDLSAWCNIKFGNYLSNPLLYGDRLYLNNNELTELVIPADIKQIKDYAFYGYKGLTKVTMGEAITSIGIQSFRNCSSLTQVSCQGTTPPTINPSSTNSSFNGSKDGRTLYVPKGYLSAYQSSSWANYFGTITEME